MRHDNARIAKLQFMLLELKSLRRVATGLDREQVCDWIDKAIIEIEMQIEHVKLSTVH